MQIFFDITQFLLQHGFRTPTGISRVELAYVKHLLLHHRDEVTFISSYPPQVHVIPTARVRRFVEVTEACWQAGSVQGTDHTGHQLAKFIGTEAVLPPACPVQTEGTPHVSGISRHRAAFSALAAASAGVLTPRKVSHLVRNSTDPLYLSVSGWRLPTPWIARWLARMPQMKSIFLLHDIIPLTHPGFVREMSWRKHKEYVDRVTEHAALILANSQSTADALSAYMTEQGRPTPPTRVIPLGYEGGISNDPRLPLPDVKKIPPYFVTIGTIDPRKNHTLLLNVWSRLVEHYGESCPKLIIIGKRGWAGDPILHMLDRDPKLQRHVIHSGHVQDSVLFQVMRHARAILFPSFAEGFGLPLSEAMVLGAPVICSDIATFREIGKDIPEFIDPLDQLGWLRCIQRYSDAANPARLQQVQKHGSVGLPSWESHFSDFEEGLRDLTGRGPWGRFRLSAGSYVRRPGRVFRSL